MALSQVQFEANSLVGNGMITGVGETILNDRVAENIAKGKQLRNLYESNPRHPIVREALKKAADQGIVIDIAGGNRLDINPEANKPKILITPLPPVGKPDILSTPDERDKIGRLKGLSGFHPPSVEELADNKEGFDLHQTDWRDLILYKKSDDKGPSQKIDCAPSQSQIWTKELQHYKNGVKTNGLTGKHKKFYKWDHRHNEIEVFGPGGREHLGAIHPITGKIIKKSDPKKTIKDQIN